MGPDVVSVLESFRSGCESSPNRPLYTTVDDDGNDKRHLTVREAYELSDATAGFLHEECGLRRGDRAILAYTPSMEFVTAFLGCLRAGVVPVPVPPPDPSGPSGQRRVQRFAAMCEDVGAKVILANREYVRWRLLGQALGVLRRQLPQWPRLPWRTTDAITAGLYTPPPAPRLSSEDVAYIQFTSGTTGEPKGVQITHGNLQHQLAANADPVQLGPQARAVLWVPHFHDLCLVSGILNAMFGNGHLYLISPLAFVRRPAIWFDVMSRVRATHTAAPNLAFEIAIRKTTPAQRQQWDLSTLRTLMTAAEPIRQSTVRAFYDAFFCTGLRDESFCPAYGMAEQTVGVAIRGRTSVRVDRGALEHRGTVREAAEDAAPGETTTLVSCGPPVAGVTVRIVDPETHNALEEGREGEIWIHSPSSAAGYVGAAASANDHFDARLSEDDGRAYFRTGDLGVLYRGELFFTGRREDVIRISGRTLYPHHLEDTVRDAHALVRPGCVVATWTEQAGRPVLAILAEVRRPRLTTVQTDEIAAAVRRAVLDTHHATCAIVWLGRAGSLPKTTSGKLMRGRARTLLALGAEQMPGTLHVVRTPITRPAAQPRRGVNVLRNLGMPQ